MKQNDWTQNLRSRLGDRKAPVPDDLWDRIESRINMADGPSGQKPQRGNVAEAGAERHIKAVRLIAWAMSAAAVAALLVTIGYQANRDTIEQLAASQGTNAASLGGDASANGAVLADNSCTAKADGTAYSRTQAAHGGQVMASAYACADTTPAMQTESGATDSKGEAMPDATAGTDTGAEGTDTRSSAAGKPHCATPPAKRHPQYSAARYADYGSMPHSETAQPRWTVGVHTAGTFSNSRTSDFPMQRFVKSSLAEPPINDCGTGSGGMTYSNLMSSNPVLQAAYKEVTHHAQPVSIGLSLEYALGDRLSLVSGLVYTRASSDFIKSAGGDDIVEKQRLHYIGVPLGLKCRVWSGSAVHAYATAGAQADFNVSATLTSGSVKADIDKDRVQFSANAAAGVQVDVAPHVGVYAEPGVKYYFDNGSQMQTAFKDTPWSFSLQIGLRVGF